MGQPTSAGEVRQITSGIEKKYDLPEDMLFKQAGIESSFGKNMLSPAGAKGWFGFMDATATEYGLNDPHDLEQSADAAGRKMRDLLRKHSGNVDYALVDYNGGGKAVRALKAGKPWGESAGYLEKYHGNEIGEILKGLPQAQPQNLGEMGEQFTSQTVSPLRDGPSATALAADRRKQAAEYGGVLNFGKHLPSAVSLGFQTQNSVWNYYKDKALTETGDPLDWNAESAQETLKQFPQDHWGYLLQATTKDNLEGRVARLQKTMEQEQELGNYGVTSSIIGGIAGGLPDIPTLIAFLPGVGGAGLLTKASRLSNAVRLGLVGAASNVAYDAVANQYKPTATVNDLYISGLFGLGMGALGGGAASLKKLALADDLRQLREYGLKKGADEIKKEIEASLPKPNPVEPFAIPPRDEFLKKLDEWSGGLGRNPPEKPRMAILSGGPEEPVHAPKPGAKGVTPPDDAPTPPRSIEEPLPSNPNGKPWDSKWDSPVRRERMGAPDILQLPGGLNKISHFADYIRTYSTNKDIVALMDRALKGLDLRKLKFDVIDPKADWRKLSVGAQTAKFMDQAYGVVNTPHGSRGDGIEMALRGRGWGEQHHGLNEETFVHEVLHAATVYKWHRVHTGNTNGMHAETVQAYRELDKLFGKVKKVGSTHAELPPNYQNFMKNSREFISYGLTNRPFQEWLKSVQIEGGKSTLWTRFTDSLRKMLGMTKEEGNAYARLIDLSEHMLDQAGIEGKAKTKLDLQRVGEFIDAEDAAAANQAGISPVFGWGLGLEHRLGSAKLPEKIRSLAADLFGTTVGYKDHAVVKRNAWDDTVARSEALNADLRKVGYPSFERWMKEQGKGAMEKRQAFEDFNAQVSNYIRGFEGDFHPEVKAVGDHIRKMMDEQVDHINNPGLRDGTTKRGLTEVEVLDEATGEKMLVGKLQKNPHYLPRKADSRKWHEFVRTWGKDAAESFWANAWHKKHPDMTAADAKKFAGWYVRTVEEAHMNRSADHLEEMMTGYDEKALRESMMRNGGFTEDEARKIIREMFRDPTNDAGRTASSLRHRNLLDETHTEKWVGKDGKEVDISINDFIQTNAMDVAESYFRRTSSSVSLADRLGIYKQSDIGRLIDDAAAREFGQEGFTEAAASAAKKDLKFAFDRIQGIPQEEFTVLNKSMAMWRDFNVVRLMGGAVWNQASELSQIVGSMGWKATLGAVKELRSLRRDIATGKAPHDLLDHLENTIGGVGSEYVSRLDFSPKDDWVRYKGDSAMNRRLDSLDTGLKVAASKVLDYTGMTGLMVQQKRIHAIALTNHFVNAAVDKPSTFLSAERLAWMGLGEADYAKLNAAIKAHSKAGGKGQYGAKVDFDFKTFAKANPEENSMLMNALHRETRRVVQENDLASMVPLMGTTLGKTVFQFMNFTIHAWNKSMLFAMNHKDWSTLSTVLHGSFFASLAYMGRTQLSALGMEDDKRQEFLDKRMSAKQIVANSFGKISQASLLPTVFDTVSPMPMFSGMRTTSDISSFASNPTYQAINGLLSTRKIVRNALSDDYQTTERDVRTWGKLLPLNNVAPVSTFINALATDFPHDEDATK